MTSPAQPLSQFVRVQPRFARSISLVRDAGRPDAIQGYIQTPTACEILRRLANALSGDSPTRAWTLGALQSKRRVVGAAPHVNCWRV